MGLAVAIQMDPIDTINIDADSTFALALEAQARAHALYHYLPQALTLRDGRLYAPCRTPEVFRRHCNHPQFGEFEELDLAGFQAPHDLFQLGQCILETHRRDVGSQGRIAHLRLYSTRLKRGCRRTFIA